MNSENFHKVRTSYYHLPIKNTASHEDMQTCMYQLREKAIREIAQYILDNKLFEMHKEFDVVRNAERVWIDCYVGKIPM